MSKTAIIFDLDGVLVSTDHFHYLAWKKVADDLGIPFNDEINHHLRGVSRMDSLEIILKEGQLNLSKEEKEEIAEEKNRYYLHYLEEMSKSDVAPVVSQTLLKLKDLGIKLAIGSSSKNARFILTKTELMHYFDAISDGNNIAISKPDPEVFLKASEYLMEDPKNCVVIEDAESGIIAAKAANMYAVAMNYSGDFSLPDQTMTSFDQILEIVEAL